MIPETLCDFNDLKRPINQLPSSTSWCIVDSQQLAMRNLLLFTSVLNYGAVISNISEDFVNTALLSSICVLQEWESLTGVATV